jgi:hypothetical protein
MAEAQKAPMVLHLLLLIPLSNALPMSVGETCDLLVTKRIQQR